MRKVALSGDLLNDLWLRLIEDGQTTAQIARRYQVSVRTVQQRIVAAHEARRERGRVQRWRPMRGPILVPLFPIGSFTPRSECPHRGPIREGSVFCCMVCSKSGMDGHPALRRDPRTDPKPDPKPTGKAKKRETRKQRRARLKAGNPSPSAGGAPR